MDFIRAHFIDFFYFIHRHIIFFTDIPQVILRTRHVNHHAGQIVYFFRIQIRDFQIVYKGNGLLAEADCLEVQNCLHIHFLAVHHNHLQRPGFRQKLYLILRPDIWHFQRITERQYSRHTAVGRYVVPGNVKHLHI